jgi:hypothetical protein
VLGSRCSRALGLLPSPVAAASSAGSVTAMVKSW